MYDIGTYLSNANISILFSNDLIFKLVNKAVYYRIEHLTILNVIILFK